MIFSGRIALIQAWAGHHLETSEKLIEHIDSLHSPCSLKNIMREAPTLAERCMQRRD